MRRIFSLFLVGAAIALGIAACATGRQQVATGPTGPIYLGDPKAIPPGGFVGVCAGQVPVGWIIYSVTTNSACGATADNVWTIQNLNGYTPGAQPVSCCRQSPIPGDWFISAMRTDLARCGQAQAKENNVRVLRKLTIKKNDAT